MEAVMTTVGKSFGKMGIMPASARAESAEVSLMTSI
jgi:hypothetical protein